MSETYSNMQSVDTETIDTMKEFPAANQEVLNKLGESNGNLTYDGKPISGGNDEIYIGSGEMPEGYVLQIDPDGGSATTIPTKTSELENDSGFITQSDLPKKISQLENDSGYITADDLPEAELPSVTESDNGKILRVVNGVWAADTIPDASGAVDDLQTNFELIEEVVIEESVAEFKRAIEPDGTPYDFRWIYVYLYSPNTNGAHGGRFYFYNASSKNLHSPAVSFTNTNDYMALGVADIFGGRSQNAFFSEMSRASTSKLNLNMDMMFDEHISRIEFKIPTNESVLMKDDIIRIYGVRW